MKKEKFESSQTPKENYPADEKDLLLELAEIWPIVVDTFEITRKRKGTLSDLDRDVFQSIKNLFDKALEYYRNGNKEKCMEYLNLSRQIKEEFIAQKNNPPQKIEIKELNLSDKEKIFQAKRIINDIRDKFSSDLNNLNILLDRILENLEKTIKEKDRSEEIKEWENLYLFKDGEPKTLKNISGLLDEIKYESNRAEEDDEGDEWKRETGYDD